jgi:hypothetical protein
MKNSLNVKGHFDVTCVDANGQDKWTQSFPNGIVDEGIDMLLEAGFNSGTQSGDWYIGLIDNSPAPTLANGDTLASHAGWTENSDYAGNRPAWGEGTASGRTITNATTADFVMNATVVIYGIFVGDQATGTSGTLWSTAAFSSTASVTSGDTLKVTYTVSG